MSFLNHVQRLALFVFALASSLLPLVQAQTTSFDAENWQYNNCYSAGSGYSYCLNIPPKYKEKDVWPLLVFLTGSGAKGTKSQAPYLATYSGVGQSHFHHLTREREKKAIINTLTKHRSAGYVLAQTLGGYPTDAGKAIRDDFVTVLVIPPTSAVVYDPDVVAKIVNNNLDKYKTSPQLVYLTGYSMGCRGTIRTLVYHPDLFAAAVCSAGYAERPGDKYLAEDKTGAEPTYPLLGNAAGIPIAFGYGTKDETNPGRNTAWTKNKLAAEGALCNTL